MLTCLFVRARTRARCPKIISKKTSHSAGFEPARGDPSRFRVYRLNRSATNALKCVDNTNNINLTWNPKTKPNTAHTVLIVFTLFDNHSQFGTKNEYLLIQGRKGGERLREKCRPEVTHVDVWCKHRLKTPTRN